MVVLKACQEVPVMIRRVYKTVKRHLSQSLTVSYKVLLILLMVASFCWAREDPGDLTELKLEELMNITVQAASRFEQRLNEAPSYVNIVTADEIKKYGFRTLADILRSLSGFQVTNDRNYSYGSFRGFGRTGDYNSRILVLIDGHRLNDNVYDSVLIGNEFIIDTDLFERVEVIRGPSSSLYGNNAFFAVVNIITRKGKNLKGAELSGEAGSFQTYGGRISYGNEFQNLKGLEVLASGSLLDSNGQKKLYYREYDDPATNNGVAKNSDYERNYRLLSTLSYSGFTLQGAYVSRTKGIPTAPYGTDFNDSRNRTVDDWGYLDLKYEHQFENRLGLMAHLHYDSYKYHGDYILSGVTNRDDAKGNWWGGELHLQKTLFEKHRVIAGADYQDNTRQDQRNYDEDPYFLYIDDKRKSQTWALYLQDEFTILKNLILNAGVRYDHYSTFGSTTNPRLALIYSPFQKTTFKLLYGTAFRAPNAYELYYSTPDTGQKSNPDLMPEKISTYELVWEQSIGSNLRLTAAGFYYKITDLISQQVDPADGLLVFSNVDEAEAKGIQAELEGTWEHGLKGSINYTYQKARNSATKEALVNSPQHLAKLNLIVPFIQGKLFGGLTVQYTGKRKTLAENYTESFIVTNVTLFSQKLLKGLEISASVYNLFNQKYDDPAGGEYRQDMIEQDGRSFRVKFTYAF